MLDYCLLVGVKESVYFKVINLEIFCNMVVVNVGILLILKFVVKEISGVKYILFCNLILFCVIGLIYCLGLLFCICYECFVKGIEEVMKK